MSSNRRQFFKRTGLLATSALAFPSVARSVEPSARPRHIVHLVSDGMSMGTLTLADHFSQLSRQRRLRWFDLYQRPETVLASVNMRSLNSLVTDSSAASSGWGSGSRVVNGVVNKLPDGRELRPLYSVFAEAGWKRGLVTTTEITHATPAGFAANASSRDTADVIAAQYLERKIEVLLGGGKKFFEPAQRKDKRDLRKEFRGRGYVVMDHATELAAAPLDKPWLGTFANSHLPFTIDQIADAELLKRVPTLAQMSRTALGKLEREDHFILQIEGGRVDHGAHNCDIAAAVRDQIAFDDAIEAALEFQRRMPDTLLILTTDHGTGNPGLNATGALYRESTTLFAHVLQIQHSFAHILKQLELTPTVAGVRKVLLEETGYKVPEDRAALFATFLNKTGKTVYEHMNSAMTQLGQLLANHVGVGWSSGSHTADYVPLLALGPGAEKFRGFLQNTDLFRHYTALAKIDFRNPEAPLMAEMGPSAGEVEPAESYA